MPLTKSINWYFNGMASRLETVRHVSVSKKNIKKLKHSINIPIMLKPDKFSTLFTSKLICELYTKLKNVRNNTVKDKNKILTQPINIM